MHDFEIIELYWNRDERAIAESDIHYGAYCRRISMNILSNAEDTEECVNDTWRRAWENIPPQKPSSLSAFFGRIVRNSSISRYRANRAKKRFDGISLLLSELEDCLPSRSSAAEEAEGQSLSETLGRWLSELPQNDRILFIRRYWYGDSVKSLAKESGITQNQLSKRMLRLRKKLREILEQEGFYI